ncbi:hypothetical protein HOL52_04585, partial [bacterium]|nr:hypothetical protein [bacterium]
VEEFTTEKVSELKVKVLDNDFSSIDVLAYYISIKDINVEEFTTEKVSELRAKLINDDFSSVEVLAYYLSIKDTINFTTEESKEMNKFLMYGSMKVEIDESLKSRVFEYILFLKDKYSSLSDDTENNDLLLKHFNLSNIDEIDLLRNSFEIHKSIYASKPNDSSLINLDELMPGCFELAYEKNKIAIQSLLEAQKLNNARTRMLGSLKSRGEDLQAELSISENIDNILQVKPADSERRDVLNLEYFLNSENFPEIFNLPLDSIVDSEQRAVDKSTDQSLFEFSIWSKGKNNPNQDCAIAFDQGMVLCDGAGSAEKSELVSAFFSNFIYTYREKISSIIDSIGLDETLLKKFLSYVLAYASLEFKKLYPALSNGRSYSTLSMVFKVFPQDIESKTMVSFTIGDSPVINGENFVSGHTDLIDLAYDPNNLTKLLEILQDYHYNSRSAFDFCLLEQKIKLVDSLVSDDVFIDDWFLDLETLKMLIDKFNLLTICKSMLRNVVQTCVPRFSNDEDQNSLSDISNKYFRESELNVFQYSPDQPVSICSDGLSDNFSATGILDVSLTPVDELNSLDLDKSNIDRSDINSMFGYKNDDATIVRMDLKPELLEFAQMPLVPIPEVQTPVNETLVNLESDIYFENIPYVPEQSESINSETQIIKSPSQFALLKSKVSSWFKSSNKSLDRNKSSLVTKKVSWFEKFKSKLLTINYAQSLQKFLTYKTIAVFSIGILTYLLKDGDLASQLFQSIDSFITVDQPNEPSSSDQNFQISFQENLGGEIAGVESTTDLQEESEVPVAGAQISDDNKEANSNSVLLSQNINVTYPSEPSHTDLIDSYDPDQDPIIQNATNDVSNQVFNLFPENSNTPGSGVLLSVDDLNTTDNPPDSFLLDSIIEVNPDDVFEEVEIENQMEVNSRYFTNVNCEVSETTLSENGVDSLNPSDSNINTNISYSVNLNDEDSSLLKRDETGRVVGSLKENESFKFTGSTDLVSANNGSDDILYAEAKTSDGNTFWVARAYAKPMA